MTRHRLRMLRYGLLLGIMLVAKSAAFAHLYNHLRADIPCTEKAISAGQSCAQCLAANALLSGTACAAAAAPQPIYGVFAPAHDRYAARLEHFHHPAFRSRAPPIAS